MNPKAPSLIGRWFHSWEPHGGDTEGALVVGERHLVWQGQILARHPGNLYEVQLYSYLDGAPTDRRLVREEQLLSFTLYDSNEEMRARYDELDRRYWKRQGKAL